MALKLVHLNCQSRISLIGQCSDEHIKPQYNKPFQDKNKNQTVVFGQGNSTSFRNNSDKAMLLLIKIVVLPLIKKNFRQFRGDMRAT
ncbi:MAG: hypothetical protein P4M11_10040 [Candidatus Pacebacteria bacterium]|nr:hypothetical protein [Candidatus Paceibacterota bacterium]